MSTDPIADALERLFSLLDWWPDEKAGEAGAVRWQRVMERELGKMSPALLDEAVTRCTLEPLTDLPIRPATMITYYNWVEDDYAHPDSTVTYGGMWAWCTARCAEIGFGETKRQARVAWLTSQLDQYGGKQRRAVKLMLWRETNLRIHLPGNAVTSSSNNT